jgi:hypothetical protein
MRKQTSPRAVTHAGLSHECASRSFTAEEKGLKVRERSESFADHYIVDALIFELSRIALNPPKTSAGRKVGAPVTRQKIGGGPSVLYDAVAILPSKDGANILLRNASAKDFISDAFRSLEVPSFCKERTAPVQNKRAFPKNSTGSGSRW